jgi:hypothetical protein
VRLGLDRDNLGDRGGIVAELDAAAGADLDDAPGEPFDEAPPKGIRALAL